VTYRRGILDPQGDAVARSLVGLGFDEVSGVRIGKLIDIELCTTDRSVAERRVEDMCRRLLANPVIEDYRYEVLDGADTSQHPTPQGP
jgi:phosphoribosylformylglycinamidine synthase